MFIIDENDDLQLQLLHYTNSHKDTPPSAENYKYRGLIVDTNTNKIVCCSHPYTPEVVLTKDFQVEYEDGNEVEVNVCLEGTVLRLFFFDGEWRLSTYKKINGRNSRWNARKFGEYFDELFGDDYSMLDKNICYTFLLSHQDTAIITTIPEPKLYFVLKWNIETQRYESTKDDTTFDNHPNIARPEMLDISSGVELEPNDVGLFVTFFNTEKGTIQSVKYITSEYKDDRDIRGNEPNLRIAYFNTKNKERLRELLPHHNETFDDFDEQLKSLSLLLYTSYIKRFVRREFCEFPKEFYVIMKKINTDFCDEFVDDADAVIKQVLSKFNGRVINAAIKYMISLEKEETE